MANPSIYETTKNIFILSLDKDSKSFKKVNFIQNKKRIPNCCIILVVLAVYELGILTHCDGDQVCLTSSNCIVNSCNFMPHLNKSLYDSKC